ncbi:hypothetical protein HDU96_006407 [Phlyctochytrium bullatum]|nr:hypothetical protein HDU96_006407 [Phlyctochytrium bullatum]
MGMIAKTRFVTSTSALTMLRAVSGRIRAAAVSARPLRRHQSSLAPLSITSLKPASDGLELTVEGKEGGPITAKFHYPWLRDHCPCPSCIHEHNRQKLHSSADVNHRVVPESAKIISTGEQQPHIEIIWPKGSLRSKAAEPHVTRYPLDYLISHSYQKSLKALKPAVAAPFQWTAAEYAGRYARVEFDEYMGSDQGLLKVLTQLRDYGLAFLKNVPTANHKEIENVARRIGCIRETFYGTSWDVKSVPQAKNIAYTSLDLGLHMDLMYFEAPPGVQLLHSLKNSVEGGESTFLDVFKAVALLKAEAPSAYDILKTVPVTFHYDNDGHFLKFQRPTVNEGDLNEGLRVYYAPPFQGVLEADESLVGPFYEAFATFQEILSRKELVFRTRLQPGDLVLFHNRRVLHGRDEFDASSGDRHFKGTYVDWDDFKDKLHTTQLKK